MYIVLEGVVGVGKSTQSKLLFNYLKNKYPSKEVLLVREPGGTPMAEAIRKAVNGTDYGDEEMHPLTDVYLFAAARAQLLQTVVKSALERGSIVLSDRSVVTSLVYQGYVQEVGIEKVWAINSYAIAGCLPDMILFLDIPVEIGYGRTFDAQGDKRERKPLSFFQKAHEGFEKLFSFLPLASRMKKVDANTTITGLEQNIHGELQAIFKGLEESIS